MSDSYYNDTYGMGVDSDGNSFYYNSDTGMTYYSDGNSSYYNSNTDMTYYSSGDSSYYNSGTDITYYSDGNSSYYNSSTGMRYGGPSASPSSPGKSSENSSYSYNSSGYSHGGSSYSNKKSNRLSEYDKELGRSATKVLGFIVLGFAIFCFVILAIAIIGSNGALDFLLGPVKLTVTGINCTVTDKTEFSANEKTDFGVVPDPGYEFAYFISGNEYIYETTATPDRDVKTVVAVCLPEGKGTVVGENSITIPISTDTEAVGSEYFYSGSDAGVYNVNNFFIISLQEELSEMAKNYNNLSLTFTLDIREEATVLSPGCSMYGQDLTNSRQVVGILFDGSDMGYVTFDHGGDNIDTEYANHTKTVTLPIEYLEASMQVFFRIDNNYINGTDGCPAWYMKNAYITFTFSD